MKGTLILKLKKAEQRKRRTTAIVLSAVVCPGAGQCVQGRYVVGVTTILAILGSAVWALVEVIFALAPLYNFSPIVDASPLPKPDVFRILLSVGVVVIIWIANIIDVLLAKDRGAKRDHRKTREVRED